ncbi:hypothetical protein BDZ91DRAFT_852503 [Kalaharituber pfeilii]|nr:hypothetical protein BDZ91DRAFT_852503 [Kalaharituber pfeilii]
MEQQGELLIITDSQTAIARLRRIGKGDPTVDGASTLVRKRWEDRIAKGDLDLAVIWVKSHKGVKGNTEADWAAKVGTALQYEDETVTEAGIRQEFRSTTLRDAAVTRIAEVKVVVNEIEIPIVTALFGVQEELMIGVRRLLGGAGPEMRIGKILVDGPDAGKWYLAFKGKVAWRGKKVEKCW